MANQDWILDLAVESIAEVNIIFLQMMSSKDYTIIEEYNLLLIMILVQLQIINLSDF